MFFNSPEYLVFSAAVAMACWLLPPQRRWAALLGASAFYYVRSQPAQFALFAACAAGTFWAAGAIERTDRIRTRRVLLTLAVAINLGPLLFFKYFDFLAASAGPLLARLGVQAAVPHLGFAPPLGISFFALQAVAYVVDVYRGSLPAEGNLGRFALFLGYFPKLLSGPIERGRSLLPRLRSVPAFEPDRVASGTRLFLWGVFKKAVIADRLALYVDMIYAHPQEYWGRTLVLACYCYAIQIYCDFSGYTDMARGCSRILGIELAENFRFPYFARSIQDFWKRWHISLTSWFRDYVYILLGGNRTKRVRWAANILAVFLVSGLWHGAAWTFVLWGALHGGFYLGGTVTKPLRERLAAALPLPPAVLAVLQAVVTFHLVTAAWVFFRAGSASEGLYVIIHLAKRLGDPAYLGPSEFGTILTACLTAAFLLAEGAAWASAEARMNLGHRLPFLVRGLGYVSVLLAVFLFGVSGNDFIYFHF